MGVRCCYNGIPISGGDATMVAQIDFMRQKGCVYLIYSMCNIFKECGERYKYSIEQNKEEMIKEDDTKKEKENGAAPAYYVEVS